jgi:hypothetical protein
MTEYSVHKINKKIKKKLENRFLFLIYFIWSVALTATHKNGLFINGEM